ncbi:hypothetical protein [Actinoplanes sp. NPDC020271]|uniref:hypothetical protein n=1 Tax=Actinoplanes sp. NPDC020271 TaxID=3363896 RepID=UPI0037B54DF9
MSDFAASIDRLLNQVRHWEESRWAASKGHNSKADLTYGLVQHLADLAAAAEGRAPREVPRLHDLVLPDQLRVVADDFVNADPAPPLLTQATTAVETLRAAL